jgi:multiple sugar transport system permease protein
MKADLTEGTVFMDAIRSRTTGRRLLIHLFLIAAAVAMIYPLLWMISSSLKPQTQIFTDLGLWPSEFHWENYAIGWRGIGVSFGQFFTNSLLIAVLVAIGNTLSCSMAAYAFARLDFKFKRLWFSLMLVSIMLPFHVLIVPQYSLYRSFGWLNTFLPLTVPSFLATESFFIFLMVQFIRGIPRDLDQAAALDGSGPIRTYWSIILPLCKPALVTTAIFSFIWSWNDFLSPLIYLNSVEKYTVSLGLRLFLDSTSASTWGPMFAMASLALAPIFIFFLIFQRLIVEGISTTGIRG